MTQFIKTTTLLQQKGLEKKEGKYLTQILENSPSSPHLSISFHSDSWREESIQSSVLNYFLKLGFKEYSSYLLSMAAAESATNAAKNGGEVRIVSYVKDNKTYLDIIDQGKGIPQKTLSSESQRYLRNETIEWFRSRRKGISETGRGLAMITSYFDCRSYQKDGHHIFSIEIPFKIQEK